MEASKDDSNRSARHAVIDKFSNRYLVTRHSSASQIAVVSFENSAYMIRLRAVNIWCRFVPNNDLPQSGQKTKVIRASAGSRGRHRQPRYSGAKLKAENDNIGDRNATLILGFTFGILDDATFAGLAYALAYRLLKITTCVNIYAPALHPRIPFAALHALANQMFQAQHVPGQSHQLPRLQRKLDQLAKDIGLIGSDSSSFRLAVFAKQEPALLRWLQLVAPGTVPGTRQSAAAGLASSKTTTCGFCDPMLPSYVRLRDERARPPRPITYKGRLHDIMGMSPEGHLLLRDQRMVHRDVRVEYFTGRLALLDGIVWRVVSLFVVNALLNEISLHLVDPCNQLATLTVAGVDLRRVRFPGADGEYTLGPVKHGIVRLAPTKSRTEIRVPVYTSQRFEARLRDCELDGPYAIEVGSSGRLTARGVDRHGHLRELAISPADISPRYKRVASLDFSSSFDVDMFEFREAQLRGQATRAGADLVDGPMQDPLFGYLAAGAAPQLTNGAEHLEVFERFILDRAQPKHGINAGACFDGRTSRRLTVFNISMSNQGDAHGVLDALIEFRRQNPDADITIVVSKLGPTEFQESLEFRNYLGILADNYIHVNTYISSNSPERQVMHGKGIVIDTEVLFSTGAVMDTQPINKADFSIELPPLAAAVFQRYTDEAILGNATNQRRAELTAELASLGVVVNDPVAGLTFVSRAQDALIRGASRELIVNMSELVDPAVTNILVNRAMEGVDVTIQVRELDHVSACLLAIGMAKHPNLRIEDTSWWEPRPHFNAIIADGFAYVGTSYFWPTQRDMIHQGRSLENGVLLNGDAAIGIRTQIDELRARAHSAAIAAQVSNSIVSIQSC
ncbi:long-chain-fatty-acid-- ligase [Trichoderma arundinaceum]|uniref:Long-chain-fatty-acid--ligase n=1 Tax=Trichoderma arundinaceum TaxID=490622 RepID=A0A395P1D3_TRIAR|nr:long-chain-fatty-acid-- ligase [Trichoderma arundinaceum]